MKTILILFLFIFVGVWFLKGEDKNLKQPFSEKSVVNRLVNKVEAGQMGGDKPVVASLLKSWTPDFDEPSAEVLLTSIASSNYPEEMKEEFRKSSDNLKIKGSFSGGKVTHEFVSDDFLKRRALELGGVEGVRKRLSYSSVDLARVLPDMDIVGADRTGVFTPEKGWGSAFYLLNERNGVRRIELSEIYLGNNDTSVRRFSDNVNDYIAGVPATVERLYDSNQKEIVNVHWSSGGRDFSISTLNMNRAEAMAIAEKISLDARRLNERNGGR
jgi:hypothetical protein